MTREDAIKVLKKKMYEEADEITIEHLDGSQCMRTINIDLEMKEAIEVLEQPMTLAEFLGWEEGQEYEYRTGAILMLDNEKIYYKSDGCSSGWCNYNFFGNEIEDLRQAKKVEEPKLKAYHVTDEYSFNYLMKELIEKGYTKTLGGFLTIKTSYYNSGKETTRNYIYLHDNDRVSFSHELVRDGYDIIEYHKEEPKYYAKIKGWELTNDNDCYWHKDENPIHGIYPWSEEEASIYTKEEWAELKITKENADFERIE